MRRKKTPRAAPTVATAAPDDVRVPASTATRLAQAALMFSDAQCCQRHMREALSILATEALAFGVNVLALEGLIDLREETPAVSVADQTTN